MGFSEPLKVQLEQGIEIDQLQCSNDSHVLVLRTNGKLACVSERTLERTDWKIQRDLIEIEYKFPLSSNDYQIEQTSEPVRNFGDYEVTLSNLPKIGETAKITVVFTANRSIDDQYLQITISLNEFEFVDVPTESIKSNERLSRYAELINLEAGESATLSATVKAVNEGKGVLAASATQSYGHTYYVHVDETETLLLGDYYEKYPEFRPTIASSVDDDTEPTPKQAPQPRPENYTNPANDEIDMTEEEMREKLNEKGYTDEEIEIIINSIYYPDASTQSFSFLQPAYAAGEITIYGYLTTTTSSLAPTDIFDITDANVCAWDYDFTLSQYLAIGCDNTDEDGYYLIYPISVSSESQDGQLDLLVSFSTNGAYSQVKDAETIGDTALGDFYQVIDTSDIWYDPTSDIDYSEILDTSDMDIANENRAFWITNGIADTRIFFSDEFGISISEKVNVGWQYDNTAKDGFGLLGDGARYYPDTGYLDEEHIIYVNEYTMYLDGQDITTDIDDDSNQRWTIIHEYAHHTMNDVFTNFPDSDPADDGSCSGHSFGAPSNTGCAWTEGWADVLPALVDNSSEYTIEDNFIVYLEEDEYYSLGLKDFPTTESSLDVGAKSEGQVAAAIWDLYDNAYDSINDNDNDGSDDISTGYTNIGTIFGTAPNDFEGFYDNWQAQSGYPDSTNIMKLHYMDFVSQNTTISIDPWLKNPADWWATDQTSDDEYLNNLNYMINKNYLGIPHDDPVSSGDPAIPSWIKNNAGWWVDGSIDDITYANGLTWLIENGVIVLGEYRVVETTSISSLEINRELLIETLATDYIVTMSTDAEDPTCEPDCFIPSVLSIDIGDSVIFVNSKSSPTIIASGTPYDGTDDIFTTSIIASGLTDTITFDTEGTYNYFDLGYPWMQGTIVVGITDTNDPPVANAGVDQSVDEESLVILDGSDSSSDVLLYTWLQTSGTTVELSGSSYAGGTSSSQSPYFTAPSVSSSETLIFQLTVKDDILQSDTDTVSITINNVDETVNTAPIADAGEDASYEEGTTVTLDGSGSYDSDGDSITYLWTQTVGESIIVIADDPLFDDTAINPQFTAPDVSGNVNLQLKLVVTDNHGANSYDDRVTITITLIPDPPYNNAPVAVGDSINHLGSDPVTIDVLFNDYDDDGDTITIQSVDTTGTDGTVTIAADGLDLTFDPTDDVFGETSFRYTITDGEKTDDALVLVTVIDNSASDGALLYIPNPDVTANANMGNEVAQIDDVNGDGYNDILASADDIVYLFDGNTEDSSGGDVIARLNLPVTGSTVSSLESVGSDKIYVGANGVVYVFDSAGSLQDTLSPDSSDYTFGESLAAYSDKIVFGIPDYDVTVTTSSLPSSALGLSLSSTNDFRIIVDVLGTTIQNKLSGEQTDIPNVILYNDFDESVIESDTLLPSFTVSDDNFISVYDELTDFGTFSLDDTSSNLLLLVDKQTDTSYLFDTTSFSLLATTYGSAGAIFVYDAITDTLLFTVENPSPVSNDGFGESVSIHNDNIIAGVPGYDDLVNSYYAQGAIYYLDGADGSTIHFVANPSDDGGASDNFGESVGATNNYILVGAPDDDTSGSNWGAVYVIDPATGSVVHHLPNPRTDAGDEMGETIAGTNDKVIAGEPGDGYVHIFDVESGTFLTTFENSGTKFGSGVSAIGDNILIGATHDATFFSGSVSVYSGNIIIPNNSPVAVDDSANATNDTPITIDVLYNDSDADGDTITIDSINIAGTQGTVINNGTYITFTADLNFDGITTFLYIASDGNGGVSNIATVSVDVSDTIAPVITLIGNATQTIEIGDGYFEYGATTDDDSSLTIDISEFTDAVGSYMIYYDSTDINGNAATTVTRTVNVVDTTPPTITIPDDQYFEATALLTLLSESDYGTAIATDNVDDSSNIIITSDAPTIFSLGDTTITWSATDLSGNNSTDTQIITLQDTTSPMITLLGDNPQIIELGSNYTEFGATATDNIEGDITIHIIIDSSAVNINAVGSYPVLYDVSDSSSNSATTEFRDVIVTVSTSAPIIASLVADDPDDLNDVYSASDTITITFDSDTNMPGGADIQNKRAVDDLFTFTESLGDRYRGQWSAADTFTITIRNINNAGPPLIGNTTVTPAGVTLILSSDGTSEASYIISPVLSGDFGITS